MIITTTAKAIQALSCLNEIRGQQISKQAAKDLFHMRHKLQESLDFYMEQVREITGRMGVEIQPDGVVKFGNDAEKRDQFMREINEVEQTEAKIDCDEIDLSNEDIKISEKFIDGTDGFIKL